MAKKFDLKLRLYPEDGRGFILDIGPEKFKPISHQAAGFLIGKKFYKQLMHGPNPGKIITVAKFKLIRVE